MSDVEILAAWIDQHRRLGDAKLRDFLHSCARQNFDFATLPLEREGFAPSRQAMLLAKKLLNLEVRLLPITSSQYPMRLRDELELDAPPVLYIMGSVELLSQYSVAIIGTRRPSAIGRAAASEYAAAFATRDVAVVSGNAPGVDAAAHLGAIFAGGATIVFPPTPIEQFVPSFSCRDYCRVVIASPFIPGDVVQPWCFLRRNTLVASLCRGALVAETGTRGGTLDTVRKLRSQRRPIWVTDLPSTARHYEAHRSLCASGAIPVDPKPDVRTVQQMLRSAKRTTSGAAQTHSTFLPDCVDHA